MPGAPTPKDRFTSLDTLALVRELRSIRRARVDKVFDLPAGGWSIVLRVPREGRRELVLVPGRFGALLSGAVAHAAELSPFARELRRLLEGAAVDSIPDPGGERFLEVVLRRTEDAEPTLVALEMFGTGNLVVARGSRLVAVAHARRWAHRTVAIGSEYARPPVRVDPWNIGVAAIEAELTRSRTDLASTLAARLALGGPLAEEVIARGGWDGATPSASAAARVASGLHGVLRALLDEVGDLPAGYLYVREGVAVDATPYRSLRWQSDPDVREDRRPTFSEAADAYFPTLAAATTSPEEKERAERLRELEHQVERQRSAVLELDRRVQELKAEASAVFDHYAEAERALSKARERSEPGPTIDALLGDRTVALHLEETPRGAAQRLFDEAKRLQAKLSGARNAVAEAEQGLDRLMKSPVPTSPARGRVVPGTARRRAHWFEQYRWFISSEGAVVIAGRDASSNDQVVKRHLKSGDIYVHADLHGAASVVVKHPSPGEPPISEVTYREAGQWAVAFSKAWRAGLAAATAFWVPDDQVSKSASSGEFVARGAWVIRGSKHLMRDLPTELAVGTVDYEGESRWTAAPPDAVRRRGTVRVLLTPGPERDRAEREVELVRELGIARPLLQSLLPAGGITVRRA